MATEDTVPVTSNDKQLDSFAQLLETACTATPLDGTQGELAKEKVRYKASHNKITVNEMTEEYSIVLDDRVSDEKYAEEQ